MILMTTATANLVKPNMFFLTQMLTLGESDLIDLELIYMTGYEPAIFFFIEWLILPWLQLPAFIWFSLTWYVYAAEVFWFFITIFFWASFADQDDMQRQSWDDADDSKEEADAV